MEVITLGELVRAVGGKLLGPCTDESIMITGAVSDNRKVENGYVFFAYPGEKSDGHKYVPAALSSGAAGCVVSKDPGTYMEGKFYVLTQDTIRAAGDLAAYYRRCFAVPAVAVTGSVGKTTTKDMIASVLSERFNVVKTQANFNNNIGLPRTILSIGADTQIRKEELNGDILDNTKIFATGSLALTDEPARSTCFAAVQEAKDHGSIIAYDPNYRASLWPDEKTAVQHMRSMIPYVDIMKISDEETLLMTDHQDPAEAAKVLFDEGVKVVAVTLDKEGAYVCTKEGGAAVPAFKANAVDATGAGDSFWGSFLLQVAQSGKKPEDISLDDAISFARFANAAASISVENYGGIPSMPTLDMVEKRLNG